MNGNCWWTDRPTDRHFQHTRRFRISGQLLHTYSRFLCPGADAGLAFLIIFWSSFYDGSFTCKTNTLPILMHQMRNATTQVSSVMPRSKKLEIRKKCETVKEPSDETQRECHEIEPNPSKDRAMHEGDNPSFWDEFIKFTFCLTVQFIFVF
jgi:hypothetical protein